MVKAGDKYYRCENNWSKIADGIIPYPTASAATHRNQIALMGAFLLCDDNDAACAVDDSFWSAYGKSSDRQIPAAVMKEILALKINGKSLKYFAAKATAEDQDDFDGMKVISATFLKPSERSAKNDGNVTKAAAAFLNGKSAEVYKISSAFLHVPYDKAAREFELKWVCPDAPKKVLTKKVAAPAEGTKISVGCP
jgi:hypothetical protein